MLNKSSSVSHLINKPMLGLQEREQGINYNLEEMKDFFMKHYNDSGLYASELKTLNLR